ncbi:DUF885 domain-containing protein [Sphingomonas alba]|uniref:DUF885 family protein n=1 Tax=Sphingomonas alba TaxID=2908208 RepID=A0ABT0RMC2_9SPHN|nr:DUF885 family protein [Sphingomonas alba]MCL6683791.1 DUF885 family protein [Sphingomonas alba]
MTKLALAVLLSAAALPAQVAFAQTPAPAASAPSAADKQLKALYEGYSDWVAKEFGTFQDAKGEEQQGGSLAHVDPASNIRRAAHEQRLLTQLNAIPATQLSADEKVNAGVLRQILENDVADAKYREWEMPANSDSNFWTYLDERDTLSDAGAYQRYIGRMRDIPRYFDENVANMRDGLKRGFTPPAATLVGRDGSIASFIKDKAEDSSFYAPFKAMPSNISAAEAAKLQAEGKAAIEQAVMPAYRKLLAFYRDTYVPGARKTVSAHDLPDGDAFYRAQIREYTTTDMTPEAIHQLGLKEVARIQANMDKTMREAGFKGTFADFLTFLKTDPQFIARTPDELLGVSAYAVKRVDGKLAQYFEVLPRGRFSIIPVPDALAPFYTSGRGGRESCQMNTYDLKSRPLYNIPVLTLHECEPGHSFQGALAEEGKQLPRFRRNIYFSGYGEGWGLYSEYLGYEMGIYRTPYERFGAESYEMWRAARLVIDTGIHRYGWSRQQAIDYLASHTALSQHEVETEVDRYISWPGQALAYKLGEITLRKMRGVAETELGTNFNIQKFHSMILGLGSVPLPELENQVRLWIARQKAAPAPAP